MLDQKQWGNDCETYVLFDILWKKWTIFIIFVLRHGHNSFNGILKVLTKMNSKLLSQRLKQLEEIWIIEITWDEKNGRNIYNLTKLWLSVSESIIQMSTKHANELVSKK